MNYKQIYDNLCKTSKLQEREKNRGVYYEVHHILPTCMGGKGNVSQYKTHDNLVLLTAKEHLFAHRLLHYSDPKNVKLLRAYRAMAQLKKNGRTYFLTSREYSYIREEYSKTLDLYGKNNPFYGRAHNRKTLKLLKEKAIERYSDKKNHPMFGKTQSKESVTKNRNSQKTSVSAYIFDLQSKDYIMEGTYNQMYQFFASKGISFYKGPIDVFKSRQHVLVNDRYYYCEGERHSQDVIKINTGEKWFRNSPIVATHSVNPNILFGSIYEAVNYVETNFKCKTPSYQNMEKHLKLTNDKKRGWNGYKFNLLTNE